MQEFARKYWWLPVIGGIAYLTHRSVPEAALWIAIASVVVGMLLLVYLVYSVVGSLATSIDELKDRIDQLLESIREPDAGPHPPDTTSVPASTKSEDRPPSSGPRA
ncbi:MAG: hypothetical protein ACR2PO_07025 [Methyloligellaceae bacterium]